jgi:AAA family ATP:ADP antiporter
MVENHNEACVTKFAVLRNNNLKASFLFINFFLIITMLYQLKPASRSIFIDAVGGQSLPYVWIVTACTMVFIIWFYNYLVGRYKRLNVVLGTCVVITAVLTLFRLVLTESSPFLAYAFYVFVDIVGVVLVEQFWCLTNSIYTTDEGKSWYGMIGTGGLVGGFVSGALADRLITMTSLTTPDLLLVADVILAMILGLTWFMNKCGVYCEAENPAAHAEIGAGLHAILKNRYLVLIAGLLLMAQVASQFVEYQFLNTVEEWYTVQDDRTAYLARFFSVLSIISIGINLAITPVIHKKLGAIAGLLMQPLMMAIFSMLYMFQGTLLLSAATKISDRGLNYSINRASKELLYVPISPVVIYRAKAWIDMFGYRLFKVFGSFVILFFTRDWLPVTVSVPQLSVFTLITCVFWSWLILVVRKDYKHILNRED